MPQQSTYLDEQGLPIYLDESGNPISNKPAPKPKVAKTDFPSYQDIETELSLNPPQLPEISYKPAAPPPPAYGGHWEKRGLNTMWIPDTPPTTDTRGLESHLVPPIVGGIDAVFNKLRELDRLKGVPEGTPTGGVMGDFPDLAKNITGAFNNPLAVVGLGMRALPPDRTAQLWNMPIPAGARPVERYPTEGMSLPELADRLEGILAPGKMVRGYQPPETPALPPSWRGQPTSSVLPAGPFTAGEAGVARPKMYDVDFGPVDPNQIGQTQIFEKHPITGEPGSFTPTYRGGTYTPEPIEKVSPEIAAQYGTSLGEPTMQTGGESYPGRPTTNEPLLPGSKTVGLQDVNKAIEYKGAYLDEEGVPIPRQESQPVGLPQQVDWREATEPSYGALPEKQPLTEPAEMARIGKGTGVGFGPGMGKTVGRALYGSNAPRSVVKELSQNALDQTEALGPKGKIDIVYGTDFHTQKPYVQVSDNGTGLTREQFDTVFTDLGESGKVGDIAQRGKFGIGKGAALLGGDHVQVTTVALDKGKKIQIEWSGTPDEVLDKSNPPIPKVTEVSRETPTGTTIKTILDRNDDLSSVRRYLENLEKHSSNLSSQIHISEDSGQAGGIPIVKKRIVNLSQITQKGDNLGTFYHPESDTAIQLRQTPGSNIRKRGYIEVHLLNNGAYQATQDFFVNSGLHPDEIIADVSTAAHPQSTKYPWELSREKLREDISTKLKAHLNKMAEGRASQAANELQNVYENLPSVQYGPSLPVKFYDSGNGYTPAQLDEVATHPFMKGLAGWMKDTLDIVNNAFPSKGWKSKIEALGFMFREGNDVFDKDGSYHLGIYMPNPGTKKATVFVNPLGIMARNDPDKATTYITHTLLHEIAHAEPPGMFEDPHGRTMIYQLGDIIGQLGWQKTEQIHGKLLRQLSSGQGQGYLPEIQKLLQGYIESRGRTQISTDPLSKQGSSITGRGPEVSGVTEPNRAGIATRFLTDESGALDFNKFFDRQGKVSQAAQAAADEMANMDPESAKELAREQAFEKGVKRPQVNVFKEAYNASRQLSVGGDASYALNQGRPYLFHRKYWEAMVPLVKGMKSEEAYHMSEAALHADKWYDAGQKAGLFLAELTGAPNKLGEFHVELPERIPFAGRYFRATNRGNTAFLNYLRQGVFSQMMEAAEAMGLPLDEAAERYANHINNQTGHASLKFKGPKFTMGGRDYNFSIDAERAAEPLSYLLFAPRYMVSRLKSFGTYVNAVTLGVGMDPVLRTEALRNLFAVTTIAIASHMLTKKLGGSVEMDPVSADFMKNRFGPTRFDPLAGMQKYIVLTARQLTGKEKSTRPPYEKYELGKQFGYQDRTDVNVRFLQNSAHPMINFSMELGRALHGDIRKAETWKNARSYGKPFNLTSPNPFENEFLKNFVPMNINDMYQAWKFNPRLFPFVAPLSTLGERTLTYEK